MNNTTPYFDYDFCENGGEPGRVLYHRCVLADDLYPYYRGDIVPLIVADYHRLELNMFDDKGAPVPSHTFRMQISAH